MTRSGASKRYAAARGRAVQAIEDLPQGASAERVYHALEMSVLWKLVASGFTTLVSRMAGPRVALTPDVQAEMSAWIRDLVEEPEEELGGGSEAFSAEHKGYSVEQHVREICERAGFPAAQEMSAGDLVGAANYLNDLLKPKPRRRARDE